MAFEGLLEELGPSILPASHSHYQRLVHIQSEADTDTSQPRVALVSNKLLMGNRDVRQIYDKQWTVTVVDQVCTSFALRQGFFSHRALPILHLAQRYIQITVTQHVIKLLLKTDNL